MALEDETRPWLKQAACRGVDPDVFFPERGDAAGVRAAKEVCAGCDVLAECREWSLGITDTMGIFGRMDAKERSRERRRRLQVVAA